ncbi:hypothetical protein KCU81_g1557, partial [Aureobasidium melanogenum]|uniref:Zn(2)-C6 fungal-type domain-containing protein n=1 Tax=Aureobasidium melanogenum (strain CBS 110374) TaxID=1043003 RepID=A0A074VUE5_AURM1
MPQDKDKQRGRATVVDGETPGAPGGQQSAPRKLTAVACIDCRKRKRKCNGERPSCSACQTRGLTCIYDVVEGATRTEDLKQKVSSLSLRVRNLELFANKLRYSTDNEASAILAQLRLGDTIDGILGADMVDGVSEMADGEQGKEQALPTLRSGSTFGIGLAHNPAGPSLLTNIPPYDSTRSERSVSVVTGSPGLVDGNHREASLPRHEYTASAWAPPLFAQNDSQHLLFEDDLYSDIQSPKRKSSVLLDGNVSDSTYFASDHKNLWIDPSLSSSTANPTSNSTPAGLRGHPEILDGQRAKRGMLSNDARPGGDSITISSNLFSPAGTAPMSLPLSPGSLGVDLTAPAWAITSMYLTDDLDMMSSVYVDFIHEAKRLITSGVAPDRLFGLLPDVEALVSEPAFRRTSFLSQWTARLANSFGIQSLPCRMAIMWLQWLLMRWIVHPIPSTYLAIPDWYRPTPYQMFVPHPVYVDFHIWPRLRDAVIQRVDLQRQPLYWYSEAAKTLDCNWLGSDQDAVSYDMNARLTLSTLFVQHLTDLNNWSLGPVIRKHIPDACNVVQINYGPM